MDNEKRLYIYEKQNNGATPTPAQRRRLLKKFRRTVFYEQRMAKRHMRKLDIIARALLRGSPRV